MYFFQYFVQVEIKIKSWFINTKKIAQTKINKKETVSGKTRYNHDHQSNKLTFQFQQPVKLAHLQYAQPHANIIKINILRGKCRLYSINFRFHFQCKILLIWICNRVAICILWIYFCKACVGDLCSVPDCYSWPSWIEPIYV